MAVTDTDPIVRVAWQHEADRFRVRAIFKSGAVSGLSEPLEPGSLPGYMVDKKVSRKYRGEGIYEAPGFTGLFLAVGDDAIARICRMVEETCVNMGVKRFRVHDLKARPCLMVHVSQGASSKVTPCSNPQFLPEGWEGVKCVD